MRTKKIVAALAAAAMIASVIPMQAMAENTVPEGYLYYENFEGAYNTAYNPPSATGGKTQRWSGGLDGDETNHYAKYTFDSAVAQADGNMTVLKMDITGKDRKNPDYPLDRNAWYELGYKFNMNDCRTRINEFMQVSLGSVQADVKMTAWNTDANKFNIMQLTGTDDSGVAKTIKVNVDEVDGFISTKLLFNMHGDTQTKENCNTNGEAIYYVSYKKTTGETVTDNVNVAFPTAQQSNYIEARYAQAFSGFYTNEGWNNSNIASGSSFFIDDIYVKKSNTYTIKFNTGYDDVIIPDATVAGGVLATVPVPEKEGAEFIGWYEDAEFTKPFDNTNITSDMTVYAKWKATHTITFNSNGGSAVEPITTSDESITLPTAPKKDGCTFIGWFKDAELTEPFDGTGITSDMTVYAKWFEAVYYEDFEGAYNTAYNPPSATGGTTQRWSGGLDGDETNHYAKYTFDSAVEQAGGNMTALQMDITGKDRKNPDYPLDRNTWYELGYKFDMNDCRTRINSFMQISLGSVAADVKMPAWNTDANKFNIMQLTGTDDSGVAKTIKVNVDEVDGFINTKLLFNMHGDTQTQENCNTNGEAIYYVSYKKTTGETVTDHVNVAFPTAQKSNYVEARYAQAFSGFYTAEGYNNNNTSSGSSFFIDDIYVKKSNTYTIKFNTGYDDVIIPDATAAGGVLAVVPVPEKEGAEFIGWYEDAKFTKPFDNTNITSDMTVYAKWKAAHTITFNSNGGSAVEPITTSDESITLPTAPTKAPYQFAGWFKDEALTEPFDGTGITSNMTVYAKWSDIIFSEDFEGTYNTAFDSPAATNGAAQRWTNEVVPNDDGSHSMKYIFHNVEEAVGDNTFAYKAEVMGERANPNYPLDRNTWYELGYKFDMNDCTARFGSFMQVVLGSTNAEAPMLGWGTDTVGGKEIRLVDPSGEGNDAVIKQADVDGFITVRILFNLHGDTQNETNFKTNGEARCYISYVSTSGENVNIYRQYGFPSSSNDSSEGRSSRFLKGFYMGEGYNSNSAEGSSFLLDDIYIKVQGKANAVKFNSNGGSDVEDADADLFGNIEMPADPTKAGYTFAGWFRDEALTIPFNGTGVTSGDITVYARWQQAPKLVSITPADGSVNVNTKPEIKLVFDSEMKNETLTKNNIKLLKDGEDVQIPYELIISNDNSRNTIVKIALSAALDFNRTYSIKVLTGVSNTAGNMSEEVNTSFTTAKMALAVNNITVKDENGNSVEKLKDFAGKKINVSFKIYSNTDETVSYTPILSIKNNGLLKKAVIGTADNETAEISVPSDAEDNDELGLMIFDSIGGMKALTEKTDVIK